MRVVLLACVLLSGCGFAQPADVRITSAHITGRGVVVAPGVVLTAAHVAPGEPLQVSHRGRISGACVTQLLPLVLNISLRWLT